MFKHEVKGLKILEVGCGIELASLVLNHRLADITATDYHPEAGNFLNENTLLIPIVSVNRLMPVI
ncbi:hypothetical protein M3I01_009105 [Marinomonas sp. RSW2]|uniref:Uncharacterized protein n=1 Tax=Marinomonas maritima TaxID=2940935 RepID=A0ABT5WE31_9GAMM|nr:hypothetical protein [Marinomonas maritima]MDE8603082.1 hypothetical protein [Marinomonas maritima]